jgi:hypothetical protein
VANGFGFVPNLADAYIKGLQFRRMQQEIAAQENEIARQKRFENIFARNVIGDEAAPDFTQGVIPQIMPPTGAPPVAIPMAAPEAPRLADIATAPSGMPQAPMVGGVPFAPPPARPRQLDWPTTLADLYGGGFPKEAFAIEQAFATVNAKAGKPVAGYKDIKTGVGGVPIGLNVYTNQYEPVPMAAGTPPISEAPIPVMTQDPISGQPTVTFLPRPSLQQRPSDPVAGAVAGASAAFRRPYQDLSAKEVESLSNLSGQFQGVQRLIGNFKTDFVGFGSDVLGNVATEYRRRFGDEKGMVRWHQDYRDFIADVRRERFGASLTGTEKEDFERLIITPATNPQVAQDNLARQLQIVNGAAERQSRSTVRGNVNPSQVVEALGPAAKLLVPEEDWIHRAMRVNGISRAQAIKEGQRLGKLPKGFR